MSIATWVREKLAFRKALDQIRRQYGKPRSAWDKAEQRRKARELLAAATEAQMLKAMGIGVSPKNRGPQGPTPTLRKRTVEESQSSWAMSPEAQNQLDLLTISSALRNHEQTWPTDEPFTGKGGTFDGGGASSDWDSTPVHSPSHSYCSSGDSSSSSSSYSSSSSSSYDSGSSSSSSDSGSSSSSSSD